MTSLQNEINMSQTISVKLTHEISEELWQQIVDGFNESFDSQVTVDGMRNGWYVSNPWGYAYHALVLDQNDELMAFNTFTPMRYDNGMNVVVSGSTFVRKKFRKNVMLMALMFNALRKRVAEDGFDIQVGVPNHNSVKYALKINKEKLIGDLAYYVLPITLSKTLGKRLPGFVDTLWRGAIGVHLAFNGLVSSVFNTKEKKRFFSCDVSDESFNKRFSSPAYKKVELGNTRFSYRVYHEDGKLVAYLMDCRDNGVKSFKSLVRACRYIKKHEAVDAVLYIGFMHMKQSLLIRLPRKMVPKRLPLVYYIMDDKNCKAKDIEDPDNWSFSLMSFDVR
jgi:hypothetical protein